MELKFTASVIEAIKTMSQVLRGKVLARTRGVEFDPSDSDTMFTKVEIPVWSNFLFFHRIQATPIRRTRVEPTEGQVGRWKLEREVRFYYVGKLVAVVELEGMLVDGQNFGTGLDNSSYWGASRVSYSPSFDTRREPNDFTVVLLEVRLTGHFVRH